MRTPACLGRMCKAGVNVIEVGGRRVCGVTFFFCFTKRHERSNEKVLKLFGSGTLVLTTKLPWTR